MEALSSLDLFLLGLIEDGIDTAYLFRERARLSVGATLPALRRLENVGLVRREAKAPRNKQQFTVTRSGKQHLRLQLKSLVHEQGRAALYARSVGGTSGAVALEDPAHVSG